MTRRENILSGRARHLLEVMRSSDRAAEQDFMEEGEWFRAGLVPNIGRKTIGELCTANLIEPKSSVRHYEGQLYRLVPDEDFGDLWVPVL
jgi:hypothetical protein